VAGNVVTGVVPPGPEGVVVQPAIMSNETNTREIHKLVMSIAGLDMLAHPVSLVDSFSTCLKITMMALVSPGPLPCFADRKKS
jgi:hypothetical protein